MKIVPLALEDRVRFEVNLNVERSPAGPPLMPCSPSAGKPDAIALVDLGWNLDCQGLVLFDPAGAMAGITRVGNELAGAVALGAGLLNREETLLETNLAATLSRSAGFGLRAALALVPLQGSQTSMVGMRIRSRCRKRLEPAVLML